MERKSSQPDEPWSRLPYTGIWRLSRILIQGLVAGSMSGVLIIAAIAFIGQECRVYVKLVAHGNGLALSIGFWTISMRLFVAQARISG